MPDTLPLFPLRTVLFPDGSLPLRIFEPRYIDMIRDCLRTDRGFGIAPIRAGNETGVAAVPYPIGVLARIADWSQGSDGLLHLVVHGSRRFRIVSSSPQVNNLLVAEVAWFEDRPAVAVPGEYAHLTRLLDRILELEAESAAQVARTGAQATLYRLAERLPLGLAVKAELLALETVVEQLSCLDAALNALSRSG